MSIPLFRSAGGGPVGRLVTRTLLSAIVGLVLHSLSLGTDATKSLPLHYRNWLTKEVVYIITHQEKDAFLGLVTDEARDKFIERFWEIRNPTPGSPDNSYRAEHYRRIEYANQYFGHVSHSEGWRTDMGRIYITLGEPAQRQKLLGLQKVTPMEVWFYSNANPALPPFFYVVFYQRDPMDEFRLYSPYSDGPEKLITAVAGPTRANALSILSQDAGRDVARVTLSLLPDEPVDFQSGTASLQSDVMLGTIRNLANNPISRSALENRKQLLEDVSHRLVLGPEYLDVVTVPLRDAGGNTNLHYVLRLRRPEDYTLGQSDKGGYYYSILASVKVSGADGKLIFSDEKKISRAVTPAQFEQIKARVFGYEGWLPLPPGSYKLEFQLANLLGSSAFRREVEAVIPDPLDGKLQVSNLVAFADASMVPPENRNMSPFTGAGVKFIPEAAQELQLAPGQQLKFFYQVWVPSALRAGKKLETDYVYGRLGAQDTKTIHDEIPLDQLDAGGSVISGKQILTGELAPGNYRLVVTIREPESGAKAYGALNFGISTAASAEPAWDISDDKTADSSSAARTDYERASCYLARGDEAHALEWLRNAHTKDPGNERFRDKLIELYYEQQKYPEVIELYAKSGLSDATDDQTIVRIAETFRKSGNLRKAVGVMESGTHLHPASGPLLLGLAEYYRKTGDLSKAAEAERKGRQLMSNDPQSQE